MAGHPHLNQVRSKTDLISVNGKAYNVELTYHVVFGLDGYVVGLKFSDHLGGMDSSKRGHTNPYALGKAVAQSVIKLITPDLYKVSILGFYLLTDDLANRRKDAVQLKRRLYHAKAVDIHEAVSHHLKHLIQVEVDGGLGWAMSTKDFPSYSQFEVFERELAKELRVLPC
ncbi:hypothetical protein [uncultured Microbulbifer sp.]|uniref:hypothetical protein n=1 Tax=uncultured Microbulbifer sp. TaxID=348147 RepID=UPI00260D04FC|nr:hypothetical protein [uncultured Microbulbifer sp.]